MSMSLPAPLAASPDAPRIPGWLQAVAPMLPAHGLARIALAVFGITPASGMMRRGAMLGGFTALMLAAAWITFLRRESGVS